MFRRNVQCDMSAGLTSLIQVTQEMPAAPSAMPFQVATEIFHGILCSKPPPPWNKKIGHQNQPEPLSQQQHESCRVEQQEPGPKIEEATSRSHRCDSLFHRRNTRSHTRGGMRPPHILCEEACDHHTYRTEHGTGE